MNNTLFDDIRPYFNEEIPAAMERISQSEYFSLLASYVYPDKTIEDVRKLLQSFRTIKDFQLEVMKCVNEQVIARSITDFAYSGTENIVPNKKYLFISNHRDIVLDSCLLQYVLYKNCHETSEISFGSNLMMNQLIIDIGRSNKMYKVERSSNLRELYKASKHLSEYIRYAITQKEESIWIAQRNGRTKDGIDATDQGIIKMFAMSKHDSPVEALSELNIVPISISYEIEPCDVLKAVELYLSRREKYVKKEGEDLNSILTGFVQPKGRVNIHICNPITVTDLELINNDNSIDFHRSVAELIDKRIITNYKLMPSNYIAYDILMQKNEYASYYSIDEKNAFLKGIERLKEYSDLEFNELSDIYLRIYANPLVSKLKYCKI